MLEKLLAFSKKMLLANAQKEQIQQDEQIVVQTAAEISNTESTQEEFIDTLNQAYYKATQKQLTYTNTTPIKATFVHNFSTNYLCTILEDHILLIDGTKLSFSPETAEKLMSVFSEIKKEIDLRKAEKKSKAALRYELASKKATQ